jgi:carbon-monoxide dehydrogenase small subunit
MSVGPQAEVEVSLTVNGVELTRVVPARLLLADFIRSDLGLVGTHVGCEHGVCGACTIILDGAAVRSCIMLTVQADGAEIVTVEGITPPDALGELQQAFADDHGLQCGFCTAGFLMTITAADDIPETDEDLRVFLSGNLCRCTGYQNIISAVRRYVAGRAS